VTTQDRVLDVSLAIRKLGRSDPSFRLVDRPKREFPYWNLVDTMYDSELLSQIPQNDQTLNERKETAIPAALRKAFPLQAGSCTSSCEPRTLAP
jgi:hypothetical protein